MLDVELAGGLQLRVDGARIASPASRRARAVLAFLALNPGPQPRARVAARFWPDVLDESARASLRVALTELRQALGPAAGYLVATRDTISLEGPELRVDVREFQQALAEGDAARALEACGGPILDDFQVEWAIEARDEHAQQLASALERAAAAASDPAEAVRLTRAEVVLDPLAEAPNRRLIERLAATGDRGAALSAGRQFGERLRTQLGIAPSRETRALIEELRRQQTEPVPPPISLTRSHETVFVGRRPELARLRALLGRRADAPRSPDCAGRGRARCREDASRVPVRFRRRPGWRHRADGPLFGTAAGTVRALRRGILASWSRSRA